MSDTPNGWLYLIPPRTVLEFRAADEGGWSYTCLDCGFTTSRYRTMARHQERQARHHTLWQRLRRWWALRLAGRSPS
jgi:hypothetical protein